jgi:hypothetical protein
MSTSVNPIAPPQDDALALAPYALGGDAKRDFLLPRLRALSAFHYAHSPVYRRIIDGVFGGPDALAFETIEAMPYLPVSLFKSHELLSVPRADVVKVLTSSGTTGQAVSTIYLDKPTANTQAQVLVRLMQHFLGKDRLPMLIIDNEAVIKNRANFSARGAGILGMAQFGRKPLYALNDDMSLKLDEVRAYLDAANAAGVPIFVFGFTFMVWRHFVQALQANNARLNMPHGVLIHSGGWKKLQDEAVSPEAFKTAVMDATAIPRVINFYGMVEQVGSVFFENVHGFLHAPLFSDVVIRDPITLAPVPDGQPGLVQVVSVLPGSYPGHSILTEDMGVIRGEDVPEQGMRGRFFEVLGRVPKSEVRGCSDTFAQGAR